MGKYDHDPRVVKIDADTYQLPSSEGWRVIRDGAGWVAVDKYDNHNPAPSLDEAIGFIIGDPKEHA